MIGIEDPEHMAQCRGHQESRSPATQTDGRRYLRCNGIAPPKQQIEGRCRIQHGYATVKGDEEEVLHYRWRFHFSVNKVRQNSWTAQIFISDAMISKNWVQLWVSPEKRDLESKCGRWYE